MSMRIIKINENLLSTACLPYVRTYVHAMSKNKENIKPPNRPKKLRNWANESMVEVLKAVNEAGMGINRAALEYGVPRTTLKDRLSGRVIHGKNMGSPT